MTRTAISPRLAIRTFEILRGAMAGASITAGRGGFHVRARLGVCLPLTRTWI